MKAKLTPLFDSWSPDMAYILGFWWADGCIAANLPGKLNYWIEFSSIDREHLEHIAEKLDVTTPLRFSSGCYRLTFGRKSLWEKIQDLGGTPAKSLSAIWHDPLDVYLRDFVRGYIDGDGSLSFDGLSRVPCLQIAGTSAFLGGLSRQVYDATGIASSKVYQCKTKCPLIRYKGLKAKCMAAWLYTDSLLSLQRKYLLAMECIRWRPRRFGFKQRVITPQMERLFGEVLYG